MNFEIAENSWYAFSNYVDYTVYRFTYITYLYTTCISSFLQQHPYFFVHLKNVISFLLMLFLCIIANIAQRTFKNIKKSRSRRHADIIMSTSMSTTSPETSTCEVSSDVLWKLRADFVYNNAIVEIRLLHV